MVNEDPLQIEPEFTATVGSVLTETVYTLVLPEQPFEDVPTTEYVVVTVGVTRILDVVPPVDHAKLLTETVLVNIGAVEGICHVGPLVKVSVFTPTELLAVVVPENSLN